MKRAQTKIIDSAAPERHELTYDIDNLSGVDNFIYGVLGNQNSVTITVNNA